MPNMKTILIIAGIAILGIIAYNAGWLDGIIRMFVPPNPPPVSSNITVPPAGTSTIAPNITLSR